MGRKKGEIKETVAVRLTPDARIKVDESKRSRAKAAGWSGSRRKFTNSLIIEQAIHTYYKGWWRSLADDTRCGYCDQKRL